MRTLLITIAALLPMIASAGNTFTIGATGESVVYLKPVMKLASCEFISSAVVETEKRAIPGISNRRERFCTEGIPQERDGEIVILPGSCSYCQVDERGNPFDCRGTDVSIPVRSKQIIASHSLELKTSNDGPYSCRQGNMDYIKLNVTPGYETKVTVPSNVDRVEVMLTIPNGEGEVINVTYVEKDK